MSASRKSRIVIGTHDGKPVGFDLDVLITTRLLVQANSGGGKSWLLRRLAEQLFGKVQTIIIDPEGEFSTLREKFGYVLVGEGGETPADIRSAAMLAEKLLTLKASAICDLSEAFRSRPMDRRQWVRRFFDAMLDAPRSLWHPVVVMVDEAHKFCPQETPKAGNQQDREIIGGCKEAMIALSTTGRKRGFCPVWATQRLAKVDKDATAEFFNRLIGMTIEDVDVERAADLMSVAKNDKAAFRVSLRTLNPGQFYAFGRAIASERVLLKVGDVVTKHPESGRAAKAEPPPMPADVKALLPQLADLPKQAEDKAKSEAELRKEIRDLTQKLRAAEQAQPAPAKADPKQLERMVEAAVKEDRKATSAEVEKIRRELQAKVEEYAAAIKASAVALAKAAGDVPRLTFDKSAVTKLPHDKYPTVRSAEEARKFARPLPPPSSVSTTHFSNSDLCVSKVARPDEATAAAKPAPVSATNAAGAVPESGDVGKTPRAMLTVLAQWGKAITRAQLAAQVGIKKRGSSMRTYLSTLRSRGLIADHAGDQLTITQAGLEYLGDIEFAAPQTTAEVVAKWKPKIGPTPARLLDEVVKAGGDPIDRESLAAAAGISPGGSSMRTYLSTLRSAGLIVNVGDGIAANKETLFL